MALCQLAFPCIFNKLGEGSGQESEGGREFHWCVSAQSVKRSPKSCNCLNIAGCVVLHFHQIDRRGLSEGFEATATLANPMFARKAARKSFPVSISWIQSCKCTQCVCLVFFFPAVVIGSFGSLAALRDGNFCESNAARIKTLSPHALNFH